MCCFALILMDSLDIIYILVLILFLSGRILEASLKVLLRMEALVDLSLFQLQRHGIYLFFWFFTLVVYDCNEF